MTEIPIYVPPEADEFWPAVVVDGIVIHVHAPSEVNCNVKCYVRQNLDGIARRGNAAQ